MKHNLLWQKNALDDYLYWQAHDKKITKKINTLLKEIDRTPFTGTGKPEPLKHAFEGFWSRRIDREHRIVYQINDDELSIAQCRYHYEKA
jgi:toxin YoeB